MLQRTMEGDVAVLTMDHGPVNALDREFLEAFAENIRAIEADDVAALVITGKDSIFSAGADLLRVVEEGEEYISSSVGALSEAFGALFEFKRPAVAAVNGHALAGGAIIACACDHRIMARGEGRIGLTELRVGVPFPAYALEIVRFAVDPARLQEIIYFARGYKPDDALARGLIDEIVEPEAVMERSLEVAHRLAAIPHRSFEVMKGLLRQPTLDAVRERGPDHDREARELWTSEEVRAAIGSFLESLKLRG
jgi:enoyl-CoA hydratase